MKIIDCVQGTPEWFAARLGVPSASNFDKIITTKGEPSKSAEKYMYKLAGEFVSGSQEDGYQNAAMLRGTELEDSARAYYQMLNDVMVQQVGFCLSDGYGCSPDGFVGEDGMLEIKCPSIAVHVEYMLNGKLPTTYFQQVQGQLFVTGRAWCDFMSYYPNLRPFITRVERDETFITSLATEIRIFCEKVTEIKRRIA